MTDSTHPDGGVHFDPDAEPVELRASDLAAAVAVPPAAGPDDDLRARIEALCASWPQYTRNDPSDYGRGVAHARDAICAVLAAVPSAGLATPPEADGPVVRRDERGQMWVDGHMYDAEPEQADDMRREARELVAVAAFLDAETAAADVAEGGAR